MPCLPIDSHDDFRNRPSAAAAAGATLQAQAASAQAPTKLPRDLARQPKKLKAPRLVIQRCHHAKPV